MSPSTTAIHLAITIPNLPSSHWLNTLGTHVLATPCQTNDIRRTIKKADTDVALIDQDITRLNEVLAHAKLRRAEMYRHGQAHRALLAPVRRCPDEILSEIFIYWSHTEHHQNVMPWRTGSICRRWREVALRTSSLWSDIIVDTDRTGDRGVQRRDMLRELFRRTGVSRPISLQITSYCSPLSEFTETILPIILPTSNRWINLRLLLSGDKIQSLSPIKGALSSLKSLEIESGMLYEACDVFDVAPRLFHVNVDLWEGDITLPWTQLTDVSVGRNLSFGCCLNILSDCPNLVSCTFRVMRRIEESSLRFRTGLLHHVHLRNLKLETYVNPSAFFDCLSIPELCTFHIIHKVYDVGSFYASAANFLLRSSCTTVIFTWDSFNLCPIEFGLII
jgi:F-box-like